MSLGFPLALLAGFCWSWCNILDKAFMERVLRNPFVLSLTLYLVDLPIAVTLIGIGDFSLPPLHILRIAIGHLVGLVASIAYMTALRHGQVSRVVPLFAIAPLFTTLFGWLFLQTHLPSIAYAGIALVTLGAWTIQLHGSFLSPFRSRSAGYMLVGALCWSLELIIFTPMIEAHGAYPIFVFALFFGGCVGLLSLPWLVRPLAASLRTYRTRALLLILTDEALNIGAYLIFLSAIALWPTALVSAASSVQYFFVFVWALLLAKAYPKIFTEERNLRLSLRHIIAVVTIIVGVALLQ